MQIELRFFASFRESVGQKVLEREYEGDRVTVSDVLQDLMGEYPSMEIFDESGNIREFVSIIKNGRDVTHMEGLETDLTDGDTLSLFPPVAGG